MARHESYIPVRKAELMEALLAGGPLPPETAAQVREVTRILAAVMHYESFDELERLRDAYVRVSPDAPEASPTPTAATAFLAEFDAALTQAGFLEMPIKTLMEGADAATLQDVKIKTSEAGIRRIRFFVRGVRQETVTAKRWWVLKKTLPTDVFDDVLVTVELKGAEESGKADAAAFARLRRGARPGSVLLRWFGAVPKIDAASLHPGASAAMKRRDQLILGVPAVAGGAPLLLQLGNAMTVIFAVIAGYFGVAGAVTADGLKQALAALSGLVALGAFLMRQRLKFNAQRLDYQKRLADTVYFHTIANNAGVLDGLIGAAETQDLKEAVIAYWALLANGPLEKAALDKVCETVLRERLSCEIDFEIGDALAKLERLRLVEHAGGVFSAASPEEALVRLDSAWDGYFTFRRKAGAV